MQSLWGQTEEGSGRFQKGPLLGLLSTQAHLHGPNQVQEPSEAQTKPRVWGTFSASTTGRRGAWVQALSRLHGSGGAGPPLNNAPLPAP